MVDLSSWIWYIIWSEDSSLQFFPYAVYIDALGEWHQATFFYESMWNVCLLVAMLIVSRKEPKTGTMTCMYFVFYGLGRFLIEGLRTDSLYIISGIRASQVLSLLLILGGMLLYVVFVRRNKMKHTYLGKYANKDKISWNFQFVELKTDWTGRIGSQIASAPSFYLGYWPSQTSGREETTKRRTALKVEKEPRSIPFWSVRPWPLFCILLRYNMLIITCRK